MQPRTGTRRRRWVRIAVLLVLTAVMVVWWCDRRVTRMAAPFVFNTVDAVPALDMAVVLGTSDRARGGLPNRYFTHRIDAAVALYEACKVHHFILSGDNRHVSYNEPWAMRRALMEAGVDSSHITLDFAGFRTLDSMVRAKEVFKQQRFVVVSQRFHTERAVFIARARGIDAVGYAAADVSASYGFKTRLREKLARVKVHLDLLFGVDPHFLGEPVIPGTQVLPGSTP
jgi:SanA protein